MSSQSCRQRLEEFLRNLHDSQGCNHQERLCVSELSGGASIVEFRKRQRRLLRFMLNTSLHNSILSMTAIIISPLPVTDATPSKVPNLSSVDHVTNAVVHLFHPRIDDWNEHFELVEGTVVGLTPKGRATVRLLCMNAPRRVQLREEWAKG